MRTLALKAAAILSALAAPLAAVALEWLGSAGLAYTRSDSWSATSPSAAHPRLDLTLRFDAAGALPSPEILRWNASVGYLRVNDKPYGQSALTDALDYRLHLSLLSYRGSPLSLAGYASRSDSRFGTSLSGPNVGERKVESVGGSLTINPPGRPYLGAAYDHQDSTSEIPGLALHTQERDLVTASLRHSAEGFGLVAQYRQERSDGSWVADQARYYTVTASASAGVSADAKVYLSEAYYDQQPSTSAAGSYSLNSQSFSAGYAEGTRHGEQTTFQYSYAHGSNRSAAGAADSTSQGLHGEHDIALSGDGRRSWVKLLATLSSARQESSLGSLDSQGATAGAQYRRIESDEVNDWEVGAGPLLSYLQRTGEGSGVGYGAAADVRLGRPWRGHRLALSYAIGYGNDTFGVSGWSLSQQGNASLSGSMVTGQYSLRLVASAQRGWNPVLGDRSTRTLQLDGRLQTKAHSFDATLSVNSGIAGTPPAEFVGDGLFLPAGFNSHSVLASAGFSTKLMESLVGRLEARFTDSVNPGQPDITVLEAAASLRYQYAAFQFSLEDRLSRSDAGRGSAMANLILLGVSRSIGGRY